jgi:hypothetical protein
MQNTIIETGTYKCGCTARVFGQSPASRYQTIVEMAHQLCRRHTMKQIREDEFDTNVSDIPMYWSEALGKYVTIPED